MITSKLSALLPGSWGVYLHFCDFSGVILIPGFLGFFFWRREGNSERGAQAKIKHLQAFLS